MIRENAQTRLKIFENVKRNGWMGEEKQDEEDCNIHPKYNITIKKATG